MRILIVEDEYKTAVLLKEMVELYPNNTVVHMCDSIEASVNYLRLHQQDLDIVLMDVQLSDGQSFEIFDKVTVNLPVVFCTAYHEFATNVFKNRGINYILKPFDEKEIHQTLLKMEALKGSVVKPSFNNLKLNEMPVLEKNYQTSFLIRMREKIYPVLVTDIAYVNLENEIVYLYNFKGEKHPVMKTMDEIEQAISPQQFYRINRQMVINRYAIKEFETYYNQRIVVQLTIPTPEKALVSRLKVASFFSWIEIG